MFLDPIARLRRFNRAVVREAGANDSSFLGRGRPLGVARVLYMVRKDGTDVAQIRAKLGLDSGLLSRFLRALERDHLIETTADPADRRRSIARLTPAGETEVAAYLDIIHAQASRTLSRAGSRAEEVLAAMDMIASLLNRDQVEISPCDPDAPAAQACFAAYSALLAKQVFGDYVTKSRFPEASSFLPPHGRLFVAWSDEMPVGCVGLRLLDERTGELKRLWVADHARGQGLGRRLMTVIEGEARNMGLATLKLETNSILTEALALYQVTGWMPTTPFTDPPADIWLAKAL